MTVRHTRNGRTVTLPADYVRTATELGYATTVHTAQGVTADTMHGLVTGEESRQQLYTMLTRGRTANHLYLPVVGDGDPHTILQPREHPPPRPLPSCSSRSWPATPHRSPRPRCSGSSTTLRSGSATPPPATSTPSTSPPNTSPGRRWSPTSTRAPTV